MVSLLVHRALSSPDYSAYSRDWSYFPLTQPGLAWESGILFSLLGPCPSARPILQSWEYKWGQHPICEATELLAVSVVCGPAASLPEQILCPSPQNC